MKKILLATLFLLSPVVAHSEEVSCAKREDVVEVLSVKYQEIRQFVAITPEGLVMEIWASPSSGTWSLTFTDVGGTTCLVQSGGGFEGV